MDTNGARDNTSMPTASFFVFVAIGTAAGLLSGLFGIGGGVVIVPALIYFAGFDQHSATGTSLAVLLPPVGIGAALEYYRHGGVNIRAAVIVALSLLIAGWVSAVFANRLSENYLRLAFGVFVVGLGATMTYEAMHRIGWI
jgi:uncharacterized membrane protein YfcA